MMATTGDGSTCSQWQSRVPWMTFWPLRNWQEQNLLQVKITSRNIDFFVVNLPLCKFCWNSKTLICSGSQNRLKCRLSQLLTFLFMLCLIGFSYNPHPYAQYTSPLKGSLCTTPSAIQGFLLNAYCLLVEVGIGEADSIMDKYIVNLGYKLSCSYVPLLSLTSFLLCFLRETQHQVCASRS